MEKTQLEYDTFSLKKFFKILNDESLLSVYDIDKDEWEELKREWTERHLSPDAKATLEAHRKVILEGLYLKRDISVFEILLTYKGDVKKVYDAAKITYHEDPVKRLEYLKTRINKSKQKLEILDARLKKLESEIKENEEEVENKISDINEVIASFELHGFNIPDFETFTLGRYDAYNRLIDRKLRQQKKNG